MSLFAVGDFNSIFRFHWTRLSSQLISAKIQLFFAKIQFPMLQSNCSCQNPNVHAKIKLWIPKSRCWCQNLIAVAKIHLLMQNPFADAKIQMFMPTSICFCQRSAYAKIQLLMPLLMLKYKCLFQITIAHVKIHLLMP